MEEVLHLFITNNCRHKCELCCNKLYKISEIPIVTVELLKSVQTVCLTGGEPLGIRGDYLFDFVRRLRTQYPNIENLYIYTSGYEMNYTHSSDVITHIRAMLCHGYLQGINVAPKDWQDWNTFASVVTCAPTVFYDKNLPDKFKAKLSHRLYVFKEQKLLYDALNLNLDGLYISVIDRQWSTSFNTPPNEHFARIPILF